MLRLLFLVTLLWPVWATAQISLVSESSVSALIPAAQISRVRPPAPATMTTPAKLAPLQPFAAIGAIGAPTPTPAAARVTPAGPSLFVGPSEAGFFAQPAPRLRAPTSAARGSRAPRLLDLIARAEAGPKGYDAVQYGARIKPPKRPTQMTVAEIYAWIDATPRQPHAIGRYQFIPKTLRSLVDQLGIDPNTRFSPDLQDHLADQLLSDAGIDRFLTGDLSRVRFMNNLARIWAGLPNSSGKSHYHGFAGNKAVISWARFKREMARIYPTAPARRQSQL